MRIAVVTAITGVKDDLREDFNFEGADFIAYVDNTYSLNWEIRKPHNGFRDDVRNAKIHKILIHNYIPHDYDYSIWVDGNISFNQPAPVIIEEFLGSGDVWCMTHFYTKDTYDEGIECHKLDNEPEKVFKQLNKYRVEGYPENDGMYECNVIIRKNNSNVRLLNEKWWAEICCGSRRDQVSFPYALYKTRQIVPIDMRTDKGNIRQHGWFSYINHNYR